MSKANGKTEADDAPAPTSVGAGLLALLGRATGDDLATLDGRIASLDRELAAVREVRKLLAARLGVAPPPKAKPGPKAGGPPGEGRAAKDPLRPNAPVRRGLVGAAEKKLVRALANGPLRADDAIAAAGIQADVFYRVVKCDWFAKAADGRVGLTPLGRQEGLDE
jgi:hypothetical protein